jgi:hypothetical protein
VIARKLLAHAGVGHASSPATRKGNEKLPVVLPHGVLVRDGCAEGEAVGSKRGVETAKVGDVPIAPQAAASHADFVA